MKTKGLSPITSEGIIPFLIPQRRKNYAKQIPTQMDIPKICTINIIQITDKQFGDGEWFYKR